MNRFSGLLVKVQQPGEKGLNSFRIEIEREDGQKPQPIDCIAMLVKLAESMVTDYGVKAGPLGPAEIITNILNSKKIAIEQVKKN